MKQIVITGGTSGIGLATARQFQALGHRVRITGRDGRRLDQALALLNTPELPEVLGLVCDQSQDDQIEQMVANLTQQGVRLDAVVLNAGVFLPQPFESLTRDNLDTQMQTNFTGPLLMSHALLPLMNNPSSLVFVSTIAVEKAFATAAVYAASKAAFEGAVGAMNVELADKGIRVNSVRPGVTLTDIQRKAGMDADAIQGLTQAMAHTPAGRILQSEDIVPAIEYLALDGSMTTRNAVMRVDGGYCI